MLENKDYVRELKNKCDAFLKEVELTGNEDAYTDSLLEDVFTSVARLKDFYDKSTDKSEDAVKVVRSMDELRDYLEENEWSIYEGNGDWDISQYSPAGEDFSFSVVHNDNVEEAVKEIKRYAYDFDVDEHVKMWLDAQGRVAGVPDAVALVEDAQDIKKMLDELANGVNWCEQKTVAETLADATERSTKTGYGDTDKNECVKE